jgi:hypothetical protein
LNDSPSAAPSTTSGTIRIAPSNMNDRLLFAGVAAVVTILVVFA